MAKQVTTKRLNPFDDPGPWGTVDIGGIRVPGVVRSIDGAERPDEWSVQKPTAATGAATIWRGTPLAEKIKIVTALTNRAAFDRYQDLRDTLRPKLGTKPPALAIVNAQINFAGITRVAHVNMPAPKWVEAGGYWLGEITLVEYAPPRAVAAGPATLGGDRTKPDPNADLKAEVQKLTDQVAKM